MHELGSEDFRRESPLKLLPLTNAGSFPAVDDAQWIDHQIFGQARGKRRIPVL